jgi:hypothetical protein
MGDTWQARDNQTRTAPSKSMLVSHNGEVGLDFDGDGNLYLRQKGKVYWDAGLTGKGGARCVFQKDGNLVVYTKANAPVWSTNSSGHPKAYLLLQDDHNLVVYDSQGKGPGKDPVLWAANKGGFHVSRGLNLAELATIAIGLPPGAFTALKVVSPSAGQWAQNALNAAGKAPGSAIKFVSKETGALADLVGKVPVVGPLFSGLVDVGLGGPWHMAADVVNGVPLDKAIARELKRQLKDFKEIGPYAQMVFSVIPGFGPFVAGAIGAGLALANGQPLSEALIAGVEGMAPGGPLVKMAIDAGVQCIKVATSPGGFKNFKNFQAIEGIAVAAIPVSDAVKDVIKGGLALVGNIASGERVDQALTDAVVSALPLDKMSPLIASEIRNAAATVKNIEKGMRIDKALIEGGIGAIPVDAIPGLSPDVKNALNQVKTAGQRIVDGQKVDKVLLDAAIKAIPTKTLGDIARNIPQVHSAISSIQGLAGKMEEQAKAAGTIVDNSMKHLVDSKQITQQMHDMLKVGVAMGHGAGLQGIVTTSVKSGQFLPNAQAAGQEVVATDKVVAAAQAALNPDEAKGFAIGTGLMAQSGVGMSTFDTVRGSLSGDVLKGFDMAVSLHVGRTVATVAPDANPTAAAGYLITRGMMGASTTQKTGMAENLLAQPDMKAGMTTALDQIDKAREGWVHWVLRVVFGVHDAPKT